MMRGREGRKEGEQEYEQITWAQCADLLLTDETGQEISFLNSVSASFTATWKQ